MLNDHFWLAALCTWSSAVAPLRLPSYSAPWTPCASFQDLREAKYKMEAAASELRSKVTVSEEASARRLLLLLAVLSGG